MAHKTPTERRKLRVRRAIKAAANGRKRLTVHRSSQHIYAQVIDDVKGVTIVSASSMEKDLRSKSGANIAAAKEIGKLVAERAKAKGIKDVVFDRGDRAGRGVHGVDGGVAQIAPH